MVLKLFVRVNCNLIKFESSWYSAYIHFIDCHSHGNQVNRWSWCDLELFQKMSRWILWLLATYLDMSRPFIYISSTSTSVTSFSSPTDAWICSAQPSSKFARSVLLAKEGQAPRRQIWFGPRCHTVQTGILVYTYVTAFVLHLPNALALIMFLCFFRLNNNNDRYLHCETVKASVLELKRHTTCCTLLHGCLYHLHLCMPQIMLQ